MCAMRVPRPATLWMLYRQLMMSPARNSVARFGDVIIYCLWISRFQR